MSKAKKISALFAVLLLAGACSASPTGPTAPDQRPERALTEDADLGSQQGVRKPQIFDENGNKVRS